MTNFDFLRQINQFNKTNIINKFIDCVKDKFGFQLGYIDDFDCFEGKKTYYIRFENSLLYPYSNNDYCTFSLSLGNNYFLNIAFVASDDFTIDTFQNFLTLNFEKIK